MIDRRTFMALSGSLLLSPEGFGSKPKDVLAFKENIFAAYFCGLLHYCADSSEDAAPLYALMNKVESEIHPTSPALIPSFRSSIAVFYFAMMAQGKQIAWNSHTNIGEAINKIVERESARQDEFDQAFRYAKKAFGNSLVHAEAGEATS